MTTQAIPQSQDAYAIYHKLHQKYNSMPTWKKVALAALAGIALVGILILIAATAHVSLPLIFTAVVTFKVGIPTTVLSLSPLLYLIKDPYSKNKIHKAKLSKASQQLAKTWGVWDKNSKGDEDWMIQCNFKDWEREKGKLPLSDPNEIETLKNRCLRSLKFYNESPEALNL